MNTPILRHSIYLAAAAACLAVVYLLVYAKPSELVMAEGEGFGYDDGAWVELADVNLSGSTGMMSNVEGAGATGSFEVDAAGEYFVWLKYFGNYGKRDIALWKRAYTNRYGYVDHFGAASPLKMRVSVDGGMDVEFEQAGSHRYRWARAGAFELGEGGHTIAVAKADGSPGSVTLDTVLVTADPAYSPGRREALPRQVSEYFAPLLLALFPLVVWVYLRNERHAPRNGADRYTPRVDKERAAVYVGWSVVLATLLSIMWIDTDGGFWIWLTQNRDFTVTNIYSGGDALHHRYVYPPPVALMLIALRPVFELFGAMDGITPLSLVLSKAVVYPFVAGVGVLLYRMEGRGAVLLWALNSLVIFTVAAHSMYFGLAFVFTLCLYYLKKDRHYACALTLGLALAYMSATMLLIPPFLLLLRSGCGWRKGVVMAALVLVPGFLVFVPYQLLDPAGVNLRVMGAGIATWMSMHLGMKLGGIGITAFLYGAGLAYLWIKRPRLDYGNLAAVFSLTGLIYLNIGAPFFLAWTVAFQPFIIVWAVRSGRELFYSLYVTALMVWGSFFLNTGGGLDRAGETGFFPYYVFYAWPFDVFRFLGVFYKRIEYFSTSELEVMSHSLSAGVSAILLALIASELARGRERRADE